MAEITPTETQAVTEDMVPTLTTDKDAEAKPEAAAEQVAAPASENEWQELMGKDLVMKVLPDSEAIGTVSKFTKEKEPQEIQHGDTVLVNFIARIADTKDDTDGEIVQKVNGWLLGLGDGDVLPAIEMGMRFLQVGQTGRVWSHSKFAWGPGRRVWKDDGAKDSAELPPNSNVMIDITVTQLVVDTSRLNPYFTVQRATTRKHIANDIFSCEFSTTKDIAQAATENSMSIPRALRLYQRVAADMEQLLNGTYFASVEADHPQKAQCKKLRLDCLNNTSVVYMKQGKYHDAKEAAVKVLAIDRTNLKALLRAAKASLLDPASTLEEAIAALDAADNAITYKNPNEQKEVKRMRALYKQKAKDYKDTTKAMFGNKLQSKSKSKAKKPVADKDAVEKDAEAPAQTGESDAAAETQQSETPTKTETRSAPTTVEDEGILNRTNRMLLLFQLILPFAMYGLYYVLKHQPTELEDAEEL